MVKNRFQHIDVAGLLDKIISNLRAQSTVINGWPYLSTPFFFCLLHVLLYAQRSQITGLLKHNGDVGFISNPKSPDGVIRKKYPTAVFRPVSYTYIELRKQNN